jgi:hypothetical protein
MARLIGVVAADAGFFSELKNATNRLIGAHPCALSELAHSPNRPRAAWSQLVARLRADLGHELELVFRNRRTPQIEAASAGREPCVLIEGENGGLAMIADWNDLELAAGDMATFEKILLSKLLMY